MNHNPFASTLLQSMLFYVKSDLNHPVSPPAIDLRHVWFVRSYSSTRSPFNSPYLHWLVQREVPESITVEACRACPPLVLSLGKGEPESVSTSKARFV
jgi:hypothetical protein